MNIPDRADSDPRVVDGMRSELEELCRLHEINVELIERSDDVEELLQRILDEYERRLTDLPTESLGNTPERDPDAADDPRLRNLVRFAGQAVALKARAETTDLLRRHAESLERTNRDLERALREADEAMQRLDGVLAALDAGIVILGRDGTVKLANRAATALTGEGDLEGQSSRRFTGSVAPMEDGEIEWVRDSGERRNLLVSRRTVCPTSGDEVVVLHDVTERDRVVEERHRHDKMESLLRAVGVLAHKINNPLTALLGRAQMLSMLQSDVPQVRKSAAVIDESGRRIAALIQELAVVVRTGDVERLERALRMDTAPQRREGEPS